ncbi:MAG: NAD(P)-dependent oxidoreductase [Ekhidna sp.]
MEKIDLVTFGRLGHEFKNYITSSHPEISISFPLTEGELISEIKKSNAYAGFNHLSNCDISNLKWIHSFGAGVDSFLELDKLNESILISRTTGNLGRKIGEYCLAYILNNLKSVFPTFVNQRHQHWEQQEQKYLSDQKVLILGTGHIGCGIASVLKGLCSSISGINRSNKCPEEFDSVFSFDQLEEIEKESFNIMINTLPKTKDTTSIISNKFIALFEKIQFINVGRGDSVHPNVLIEGIKNKNIDKATLDVFESEPLDSNSELWNNSGIDITPHQSGLTSIEDVIASFEKSYHAMISGATNSLFVNKSNGY